MITLKISPKKIWDALSKFFKRILRWLSKNWFYTTLIAVAVIGGVCAFLVVPFAVPQPFSKDDSISTLRQAVLVATGGVLAILTLWENRRKNDQEHMRQVHAERRTRYTTAVEQLADEKAPIRLGGVYTLVKLVDEWLADEKTLPSEDERRQEGQIIVNSLCTYIRSSFPLAERHNELNFSYEEYQQKYQNNKQSKQSREDFVRDKSLFREEQEVRQTILSEIKKRLNGCEVKRENGKYEIKPGTWSYFEYDFSNAVFFYHVGFRNSYFDASLNFSEAEFAAGADFSRAKFTKGTDIYWCTDFSRTKFTRYASFSEAEFAAGADFSWAEFTGNANFSKAEFTGNADFSWAEFTRYASFSEAEFTGNANFSRTEFTRYASFSEAEFAAGADFSWAEFTGNANFFKAEFAAGADFSKAEFAAGADFSKAEFTGNADFSWAEFTRKARFGRAEFTRKARFGRAEFTKGAKFFEATFEYKPEFEYTLDNKASKARFSYKANPEDYNFEVSNNSPYKIETEEQEHNGVKFIIPKGTELFDPDEPSDLEDDDDN